MKLEKVLFTWLLILSAVSACVKPDNGGGDKHEQTKPEFTVEGSIPQFEQKGGTATLDIKASDAWTANIESVDSQKWCTVSPASGRTGHSSITITVLENTSNERREASLKLKMGDIQKSYHISQLQNDIFSITSTSYDVPSEGGDIVIDIKSNLSFDYTIEFPSWVTYVSTKAAESKSLTFNVKKNENLEKRECKIIFTAEQYTQSVKITQFGEAPVLEIAQKEYDIDENGGIISVIASSNVDIFMTIPSEIDWITLHGIQTKAMSSPEFQLQIEKNTLNESRSANLAVENTEHNLKETIQIKQAGSSFYAVTGVTLKESEISLYEGETKQLEAVISPENATNKNVSWESSVPDCVDIDQNGIITAKTHGKAVVTVKTEDGNFDASCDITVLTHVESVYITPTKEMVEGESCKLEARVEPEYATNKKLHWESSNENIAIVDQTGNLTAVAPGKAVITVTSEDEGKTATCDVTVTEKYVPVESITLEKSSATMYKGETLTLNYKILPENATDKTVYWYSSNSSIASVEQDGVITAIQSGVASINITTEKNHNYSASNAHCEITVISLVTGIKISSAQATIVEGEEGQLTAEVEPLDATNKKVIWSSNNSTVVSIDQQGYYKALSPGNATITATSEDGGFTAKCEISVTEKIINVESVSINKSEIKLEVGESETLVATIYPEGVKDKTITWSSSDSNVATVDSEGKVTAKNAGDATISASAGGQTATCKVHVSLNSHVSEIRLNKTELKLAQGAAETLKASVLPDYASDKTIIWTSENPSIATIDQTGRVRGLLKGTTKIIAKSRDGEKTAECKVEVVEGTNTIDKNPGFGFSD